MVMITSGISEILVLEMDLMNSKGLQEWTLAKI